MQFKQEGTEI